MHKKESNFFQSFKERTGKNASKLTVSARRPKKPRTKADSQSQQGSMTAAPNKLRVQKEVNEQLRGSLEALKQNYIDLRKRFERELREVKLKLFEQRESNKRLRKEIKALTVNRVKR